MRVATLAEIIDRMSSYCYTFNLKTLNNSWFRALIGPLTGLTKCIETMGKLESLTLRGWGYEDDIVSSNYDSPKLLCRFSVSDVFCVFQY